LETETTRNLVRRLYDAVADGDVSALSGLIHDDIDWIIYGPLEVFPFQGPRSGKAAVLAAMSEIANYMN
jgi:ketosteroid isomerase-like protein